MSNLATICLGRTSGNWQNELAFGDSMRHLSHRHWLTATVVYLTALGLSGQLSAQVGNLRLPPIPKDSRFIQDHAMLLDDDTRNRIGELQKGAYENHQTPIVVVTIPSQAQYGGAEMPIEKFAQKWFDHWELGVRDQQGLLINKAILVLISVQDRKARIELGADWGRRWDKHCDKIMLSRMVPQFKKGDYGQGAVEGVAALAAMAAEGPEADPPFALPTINWDKAPFPGSPVPLWGVVILFALSAGCFVAAYFFEEFRTPLIWAGIGLFAVGFMLWIILIVLGLWGKFRGGGRGIGGGFSSGGGGFGSGGFSGGGGSTGSW